MKIYVNGQAHEVDEDFTAENLVVLLGLGEKRIAMEVNREIVPRSAYASHRLQPEDKIEIVHAIGGGGY